MSEFKPSIDPVARRAATDLYRTCPHSTDPRYRSPEFAEYIPSAAGFDERESSLRPAYFALAGQAIDMIIQPTIGEPLPKKRYHPFSSPTETLKIDLITTLEQQVSSLYSNNHPLAFQLEDAYRIIYADRQDRPANAKSSLQNGTSTAAFASVALLSAFSAIKGIDREVHVRALRKSYGALISHASANRLQLVALGQMIADGALPKAAYNPESDTLGFTVSPFVRVTGDGARHAIKQFFGEDIGYGTTIGELEASIPTIGCPVLFKPGQIKRYWNWLVDQAIDRNIV